MKVKPSWICNIGEQPRHIKLHFNKYTQQTDIVVLAETSYFILNENSGAIRYQKRFNYGPSCMINYHLAVNGADLYVEEGRSVKRVIDRAEQDGL